MNFTLIFLYLLFNLENKYKNTFFFIKNLSKEFNIFLLG